MFREYATKKFNSLRNGLDTCSNQVLDYAMDCVQYEAFSKELISDDFKIRCPEFHYKHKLRWEDEKQNFSKKYFGISDFTPEVFYFHHGLRFADKRILNYIKNKDFIDCGAYIGDSVLVLKEYAPKMIYCYEFSEPNLKAFKNTMRSNKITSGYTLIPEALSDKKFRMQVRNTDDIYSGEELIQSNNGHWIDVTSIDEEAKKYNFNVGFIKMDVEGSGLSVVKGAINTIKKQRPVMSIAVYHNEEELFGIKPFLESQLKDYIFEFQSQCFCLGSLIELALFCYPKEIMQ